MKALITGITGQDGSYLKELLLEKNYEVYGLVRNTNIRVPDVQVIYGDITDPPPLPIVDEIYNLAAMSHVGESFKMARYTFEVNTLGAVALMEHAFHVGAKFYQASSSELFGDAPSPQSIDTPMNPASPYGVSKLAAHKQVGVMRAMGLFACAGIAFNHESPRRGDNFVTQKICRAAQAIKAGKQDKLFLGNISVLRDWGHAKDYVRGMWQIMQQTNPADYVLATRVTYSVEGFAQMAFGMLGLDAMDYVLHDPRFVRPNEVHSLRGISNAPFWQPKITFAEMVREMVDAAAI